MTSTAASVGEWLLPALGAGFLSLFVLLARHAVQSILRKLDDLAGEVRRLSDTTHAHEMRLGILANSQETRLALGNQTFDELRKGQARLEAEMATLRARFHDLVNRTSRAWGEKVEED